MRSKDVKELLDAGIITQEIASNIEDHFNQKKGSPQNRLVLVFGILGAALVGLGIILILAHNWDNFSRSLKTFLALLPLISGQLIVLFTIMKKKDSKTWSEASSVFLFFAVGACISLISQIYNIPGKISSFMLTWMILCLPLIYLMRSSMVSLLCIIGITFYASETGYWSGYKQGLSPHWYWLLLSSILPYYYLLYKRSPRGNFMVFHNWLLPLSLVIILGTLADYMVEFMFIAYFAMFSFFYQLSLRSYFDDQKLFANGFRVIGSLGVVILLLLFSFRDMWVEISLLNYEDPVLFAREFWISLAITIAALGLTWYNKVKKKLKPDAMDLVLPLFLLFFIVGQYTAMVFIIINLLVLGLGIFIVRKGIIQDHLGILNYGLMLITALIICRFFDTDLKFWTRGVLFIIVGAGFFMANYQMLKKRKAHVQ